MRAGLAIGLSMLLLVSALSVLSVPVVAWEIDSIDIVTSIIDGDTFDCSSTGRIRLADIDTPEYYEDGYQEAKDFLTGLLDGKAVYLDVDDIYVRDKYNRTVAVVYVRYDADRLENVNEALLESGLAVVWDFENEFDPSTWTLFVDYPSSPAPLEARASANPTQGVVPVTVSFTGSVSGGATPYGFSWTFGDGGSSTRQNPGHRYEFAGNYTVRFTVTDVNHNSSTAFVVVTVTEPPSPEPPPSDSSPPDSPPTATDSTRAPRSMGFIELAAGMVLGIAGATVLVLLRRRLRRIR